MLTLGAASDLHYDGLVDDLHGQQRRLCLDEPPLDRTLCIQHRDPPRRLVVSTIIGLYFVK